MTDSLTPHTPAWAARQWLMQPNAFEYGVVLRPITPLSLDEDVLVEHAANFVTAINFVVGRVAGERDLRLVEMKAETPVPANPMLVKPRYGDAADLTSGMRISFNQHLYDFLIDKNVAESSAGAIEFDIIPLPPEKRTWAAQVLAV